MGGSTDPGLELDGNDDGINLAAPKRRKRTWEEASDGEEADPEALEAARKEAEMEADRQGTWSLLPCAQRMLSHAVFQCTLFTVYTSLLSVS